MRQDLAIKKLLKIFLFIFSIYFTIKIFLKNTLIYLDSQNKERRRQETHLRSEFQLLQRVSRPISARFGFFRPISAVSVVGRYDPIWPIRPYSGRISLVRHESKPIRCESSHISTNRAESTRIREEKKKKKKKTQMRHQHVVNRVELGCSTLPATSVLSRQ